MKKKIVKVLIVNAMAIALIFSSFGFVFADEAVNSNAIIEGNDYIGETIRIPEVTEKIAEIDDPVRQTLISKYLFTPTRVVFSITSWNGEKYSLSSDGKKSIDTKDKNRQEVVSLYLEKINVLMDMPIDRLQSEVNIKEAQSQIVMKEFEGNTFAGHMDKVGRSDLLFQASRNPLKGRAYLAATPYWCTFTKEVYGEVDLLMRFWVEMDWQVSNNKITYCAPTSGGEGYVDYTYTGASSKNPTVYSTYATLTNKKGYFSDSISGGTYTVTMPTLTVYSDGTYDPTGTIY